MNIQTYIYVGAFAVFVGGVSFTAGQKYEQSKPSTLMAQEFEEFGNLFSIETGSPDQKPQSEEEYLTLTPTPTPKSEKLKTPKRVNVPYETCERMTMPDDDIYFKSTYIVAFKWLYQMDGMQNALNSGDCTCSGKKVSSETVLNNLRQYYDDFQKLETTSEKDRFKSQQYKRYSDLRTASFEYCGGRF